MQYRIVDGDMIDAICHKRYGQTVGAVEAVLEANPHLADMGPVLEAGVIISLPELPEATTEVHTVRLWN